MQSSKRILLVGHGGFYNRGCEAIVRCTVDIIRQCVPNSSILLTSRDADSDRTQVEQFGMPIDEVLPARLNGSRKRSLSWAYQTVHRRVCWPDFARNDYLYRRHYRDADVVISVGGDNFSDDYGSPAPYFRTLDAARRCGARTVIWGASIGPFRPPEAERAWAEYLKRVDLITAREDRTVEYLATLGVADNVQRVCDPAFLLPAIEPKVPIPFDGSRPMRVGIGMSDLVHKYGTKEQYFDAFAGLIEHIAAVHGCEIVLVPHVIQEQVGHNDHAACREMMHRVGRKCVCHTLPGTLNACELKYCISKCDYFVGARTHSTIASLSSLVPTISIGYSTKAWGINQDLLGCVDYVVDIKAINAKTVINTFEMLRERREHIVQKLQVTVPRARERATRGGEHLASLFNGDNGCRK